MNRPGRKTYGTMILRLVAALALVLGAALFPAVAATAGQAGWQLQVDTEASPYEAEPAASPRSGDTEGAAIFSLDEIDLAPAESGAGPKLPFARPTPPPVPAPIPPGQPAPRPDAKRAVIIYSDKMTNFEYASTILRVAWLKATLLSDGYEIYQGTGDDKLILKVLRSRKFKHLTFLGHGGSPIAKGWESTLYKGCTAGTWKSKMTSAVREECQRKNIPPDQCDKLVAKETANFGLDEVWNLSCWSLADNKVADLFVRQGGTYIGSRVKLTHAPPPLCQIGSIMQGAPGQFFLDTYVPGRPAPPPVQPPKPTPQPVIGLKDIVVKQKNVTLEVWDHGCEDGDRITLRINGKTVLSNYRLTKKHFRKQIVLDNTVNQLELVADDSGTDCPPKKDKSKTINSAAISFSPGVKNHRQTWSLPMGAVTKAKIMVAP